MNTTTVDIHNSNLISTISSPQFYGDENVYLRELLQNAMDACMTRSALEWSWGTEFLELEEARAVNSMRKLFTPRISISYNSLTQRLTVEDNGIGINAEDVEYYVSQIGRSYYTSEEFQLQQLHYEPIGHFGIGLLSCFMVARAVLIESKKDRCVNTAWNVADKQSLEAITAKWFEGAREIEYINSNRLESGTKITLVLKPKYAMRLSFHTLVRLVRKYMLYQPIPIEVSFDEKRTVVQDRNWILDNPFADTLGIIAIRIEDEMMEGYIWLYNSKHKEMVGGSCLYQQGFLVNDGSQELGIKPEWVRDMTYRLHIKKQFLTLRASRDGVANDEYLRDLRGLVGQKIVAHFMSNPIGLNQYLSTGRHPVLTEYEGEMQLLSKAVMVDVFLKGREVTLPIETIVHGFVGKVIRIAFISRGCFAYYQQNYFADFRRFLKENKLIVFENNRDIFCQFMAPYMKSQRYVISEYPGIIYDDMVADFHMEKSVVPYRNSYSLQPPHLGYEDLFCIVTNHQQGTLEILMNKEHRLYRQLEPVWHHPKVHNMMAVILENIKQRIINSQNRWDKLVDFGGSFVDDWNPQNVATVQSIWCLEYDFTESVNTYIQSCLSHKEQTELGLAGFEFRRDDFINWWFMPRN